MSASLNRNPGSGLRSYAFAVAKAKVARVAATSWVLLAVLAVSGCAATPTITVTVTATPGPSLSAPEDVSKAPPPSTSPAPTDLPTRLDESRMPLALPTFASTPTKERVEACRASEATFEAMPASLAISDNGKTNRVPSYQEYELAMEAWRRASDLEEVEPGMRLMTEYWWDRSKLTQAAATGDRKLVLKALNPGNFLIGGNGQPVDFWAGVELLNDACAAVGSVTSFNELPTHQAPGWYLEGDWG